MNANKVIVSLTTIPKRKERLIENLPSIRNQSYAFDKLVINIDDNLTEEDYKFYDSLAEQDKRIIINKCEAKWRSCNKLLPTIKMFPDYPIITCDDDVYYPEHCFKYLVEQYNKTPDCVIAHEVNPIIVKKDFVSYVNGYDFKLCQTEWGKYLSNCALFPPHVFDGTDLYDYDKMMKCTNGTHDELWFWVMSTINKVQCVGLNYVYSFALENHTPWKSDEYRLSDFNNTDDKINEYMVKINEMYGKQLLDAINSKPTVFTLNKDNVLTFILGLDLIVHIFSYGFSIKSDGLTADWENLLRSQLQKYYD